VRRWRDRAFTVLAGVAALAAAGILLAIVGAILMHGAGTLDWRFLTRPAAEAGAAGGVAYEILGTAILVVTALAVGAPFAVALALTQSFYLESAIARRRLLGLLYAANAVPSIVLGIAGFLVFTRWLGWGKSWLAGGLLLGFMILPTLTVALAERIRGLPARYLEAAAALGLRRWQIVVAVVLPQSLAGLISGALLGLARAAGETAPILFAAAVFSGAGWPAGVRDSPVVALPYHIFVLAQDSLDPAVEGHLWGAAFVLLALVLALSLLALPARLRIHEESRRA
jgi:phosphate transport system permease protein